MTSPAEPTPQRSLRDHLRAASEAVSAAGAALAREGGGRPLQSVGQGIDEAQLKQSLLHAARKHLSIAAQAALQASGASGLPGLSPSRSGEDAARAGQEALAAAWSSLGELETVRGNKSASIAAYRMTLELAPDDIIAHAQLGELLESRHALAEAKTHAERALRGDSANVVAAIALARILMREEKFADAERAAFIATKAPSAIVDEQALAWTIVGEARDRLNKTQMAFEAFKHANSLMLQRYRALMDTPHPAHPASIRATTQFVASIDAAQWRKPASFATPAPTFLIGFPRSGTTLLDQVLSSHSKIVCLEETQHLADALAAVLRSGESFDRVGALTTAEIETVRQAYWRSVERDHPQAKDKLVVDRQPMHLVLLPIITRVFPEAKFIFAERDPRDTILSCYQQCFAMNVTTARFLELDRAGDYYDAVMTLMFACEERLQLEVLHVRYEDVIANLGQEARRLADFLGVPFEQAMLHYDRTARTRTITTASARQVINPIYNRSVGRWRRYERELAPALGVLNVWAQRFGYPL